MQAINELILLIGLLPLLAIFAGLVSSRIGAPLLLVFLGLGMLAGEDGIGGILFDNYHAAYLLGSLALAVILFDGGLRTTRDSFRLARGPALALATVGVVITAGLTGLAASYALDVGWREGFLIGAIVASTDAAAVFFLLHLRGVALRPRVSATLEIESGLNDPVAVLLTLIGIELVMSAGAPALTWDHAAMFALQLLGGAVIGTAAGAVLAGLLNRLDLAPGLYPILAFSAALFVFGGAQAAGASGFLAVYLAGAVLGNRRHRADLLIRRFHDGLAWLAQIGLFVMLGLLVTPSDLAPLAGPAILVALALVFVARPLAVALCLLPFRFAWNEILFAGWVGLRGAVPIVLGTIPMLAGVPGASAYFGIAFVVVLVSLLVQGWTIGRAVRLFRVEVPPPPEPPSRTDFDLPVGEERLAIFTVMPDSEAATRGLGRLVIPETVRILAMVRDGRSLPLEDIRDLQPGDTILALGAPEALAVLDRMFGRRPAAASGKVGLGDFQVQGDTPAFLAARLYAFEVGEGGDMSLGDWMMARLGHRPAVGDRILVGLVELIAAEVSGDRILTVGIDLAPEERGWAKLRARLTRLFRRPRFKVWFRHAAE